MVMERGIYHNKVTANSNLHHYHENTMILLLLLTQPPQYFKHAADDEGGAGSPPDRLLKVCGPRGDGPFRHMDLVSLLQS